ncbi:MAG TPA: hypothetical protein VFG59_19085 [Anaeromyxobacter sp.]|nr:hypothetical protein [Anaeromyxobacter sp.]
MHPLRLLAALLLASSARADSEEAIRFQGELELRLQSDRNVPGTSLRFDPRSGDLTLADYLRTTGSSTFPSMLATLGLSGRHLGGDLSWVVTADTGELRRERFHRVRQVCWSDKTPSGLSVPGSGDCGLYRLSPLVWARVIEPVESIELEQGQQTTSNGRSFHDELRKTLLLREGHLNYRLGRAGFAVLSAGRKRTVVADGYVYDDYATGLMLDLDIGAIGPQWEVTAAAFLPSRDLPDHEGSLSPMAVITLDYLPSLFDRLGLFAAAMRERSDSLANVFRGAVEERLVSTSSENEPGTLLHHRAEQLLAATASASFAGDGTLYWGGVSGKLTPGKGQRLAFTAALCGGEIDRVTAGAGSTAVLLAEDIRLRGQLASLRYDADLVGGLGLGLSLLFLSGGELPGVRFDSLTRIVPATGTYRAFLGVSPYLTESNIFFGGGLSESYADRQATTPGVNGRGVLAPGLSLGFNPKDALSFEARGVWLRAVDSGPFGGRNYGTEVDVELAYEPVRWLSLGAEGDVLFPGDFFQGDRPITRAILGLNVLTP